ncbi:MAG: hypothetical protein QNI99_19465 [Woeseiaceae bacterium]|nr:hypothetical protein [Woeseiaceae bacterium]
MRLGSLYALFMIVALTGCGGTPVGPIESSVNERTGESFAHVREPVYLVAGRPGLSTVGKDYLVMSPVTSNAGGQATTYLYFALGSSIDRVLTNAPPPDFDSVVLLIDDAMMTFELEPWSEFANAEPMDLDVRLRESYATRVTRSQLAKIASADSVYAYVTDTSHRSPLYSYSRGSFAEWTQF